MYNSKQLLLLIIVFSVLIYIRPIGLTFGMLHNINTIYLGKSRFFLQSSYSLVFIRDSNILLHITISYNLASYYNTLYIIIYYTFSINHATLLCITNNPASFTIGIYCVDDWSMNNSKVCLNKNKTHYFALFLILILYHAFSFTLSLSHMQKSYKYRPILAEV